MKKHEGEIASEGGKNWAWSAENGRCSEEHFGTPGEAILNARATLRPGQKFILERVVADGSRRMAFNADANEAIQHGQ